MDTSLLLLALGTILLGIRLPSFLDRLGVSRKEKIGIIIFSFLLISAAWLAVRLLGTLLPLLMMASQ